MTDTHPGTFIKDWLQTDQSYWFQSRDEILEFILNDGNLLLRLLAMLSMEDDDDKE